MEQEDGRAVRRPAVDVADVEVAGVDLPDGPECPRLHADQRAVRSDLNAARSSLVKTVGSCHAAKWSPSGTSLK